MAASCDGNGPAGGRPRAARGSGRAAGGGATAGWLAGTGCTAGSAGEDGDGGSPAGRAARPAPDDPRCGFLSCDRFLFFRAMPFVSREEFIATVGKRLT